MSVNFKARWRWIGLLSVLLLAGMLHAEDNNGNTVVGPTVTTEPGKPYRLNWQDGREAVIKISQVDSPPISMNFTVTDNTCSHRQGMVCQYNFSFRRLWLELVWTKNPDASKVGQIVHMADSTGNDNPLQTDVFASGLNPQMSALAQGLPAHEISCSDFSWLPGGKKEAPASLHIVRWDGEDNDTNPETGFGENRTVGGVYGLNLERVAGHSLKIKNLGALTGGTRITDILLVSPTSSLAMTTADGEVCQTGTSSSVQEIAPIYLGLESKRNKPADDPVYLVGSLGLLHQPQVQSEVARWSIPYSGQEYK